MRQKASTIKSFIIIGVKADLMMSTAESGQQRGKTGKQLQINDRIDFFLPCPIQEFEGIQCKGEEIIFADGVDIFLRYGFQQIQAGFVFFEDGKVKIGACFLLQLSHRRIDQNSAAHLR